MGQLERSPTEATFAGQSCRRSGSFEGPACPDGRGCTALGSAGKVTQRSAPAITELDAHERRRQGGVPTVSVLVGAPERGASVYASWAERGGRDVAVAESADEFWPQWASALGRLADLRQSAVRFASDRTGWPPERVQGCVNQGATKDAERFFRSLLATDSGCGETHLCRALLEAPEEWATTAARKPPDCFVGTTQIVPTGNCPCLMLRPTADRGPEEFESSAREMARIAEAAPGLPLVIVLSDGSWADYLSAASDDRTRCLLLEGLISLPGGEPGVVRSPLGADDPALASSVKVLQGHKAPPGVFRRFEEAARALGYGGEVGAAGVSGSMSGPAAPVGRTEGAAEPRETDVARSAAERFLFELLSELPETRGLFALNADPGFRFGNRQAEVDLLADGTKLAIEIDGFHHFKDPECFRRDRRKDVALQRHGYLVMRFLADDVVSRLEEILKAVLEVVRTRPVRRAPPGPR